MFEWFALAGMALAIILAVLIGAALALIVEGNAASMEIRDERGYSDTDGKQDEAGASNKARPQAGRR